MANRSLTLNLLGCAALAVACGTSEDDGFQPEPRVFAELLITPTVYTLSTVAPRDTLQLTITAYDQFGAPISGTGTATYSSSAPAIASVSSSGVVTAGAPGIAEITAALTLDGVRRTAPMSVRVQPLDSQVNGVYDLTAIITSYDDAWGNLDGYRYTAVLTLREVSGPPWVRGTYAELQYIGPGGDFMAVNDTGSVTAFYESQRLLVIELLGNRNRIGLTLIVGTMDSSFIGGFFGCCGHILGDFKATRRSTK